MTTRKMSEPTVQTKKDVQLHTRGNNVNPRHALTSSIGRMFVYQQLGPYERFKLLAVLGPEICRNPSTLNIALLVGGIREIDGIPCPPILNEATLETAILRAGDDCVLAIAEIGEEQSGQGLTETEVDLAGE
jgi:hypothetical protein